MIAKGYKPATLQGFTLVTPNLVTLPSLVSLPKQVLSPFPSFPYPVADLF